jgi:hypothetical protein
MKPNKFYRAHIFGMHQGSQIIGGQEKPVSLPFFWQCYFCLDLSQDFASKQPAWRRVHASIQPLA